MTGAAVTQVFALENPPRLVVDLFDTVLAAKSDVWPIDDPRSTVQRVRVAQFQTAGPRPITRLVFDLKEPGLYALDSRNDGLVVSFFPSATTGSAAAISTAIVQPAPASAPRSGARAGRDDRVEPRPSPRPRRSNRRPRPSSSPRPKPSRSRSRLSAPPREVAAPPQAEVKPAAANSQQEKFKPKTIAAPRRKYSGDLISLKFKDADLRDVVLYLAEFASLNVVFDPDVRGTVTCNLQDVPWDQALDIVLRQNKMGKTIEGNVLRIAPIGVLTREEEEQRKLKESKELAGPVMVKTITALLLQGQGRRRPSQAPRSRPAARSSSTTGPTP